MSNQVVGQIAAGSLNNQHFSGASGDVLQASKVQHIYHAESDFGLVIGGTPANSEKIVFVANTTGTILNFQAMLNAVGSGSSVTFDLLKNGTTCMSGGPVTVSNATQTNRQVVSGTLTTTSFVAGDVFSMKLIVSSSTGAQGPAAWARLQEVGAA